MKGNEKKKEKKKKRRYLGRSLKDRKSSLRQVGGWIFQTKKI